MLKYVILRDDTVQQMTDKGEVTLYRIKRLRDGVLGGYIQSEANLSQDNACFVYESALVYGLAQVSGEAQVSGSAQIFGSARVSGLALVYGLAKVSGSAQIFGSARVYDSALVSGSALIYDSALVSGSAHIYDSALVSGSAQIFGKAQVSGEAKVYGQSEVYGTAEVYNWAKIHGTAKIYKGLHTGEETGPKKEAPEQEVCKICRCKVSVLPIGTTSIIDMRREIAVILSNTVEEEFNENIGNYLYDAVYTDLQKRKLGEITALHRDLFGGGNK